MPKIILSVIMVSLLVAGSHTYAGEAIDLAAVKNKVTIDVRKDQSSKNLFMIIFFARQAVPEKESKAGHTYAATLEFQDDTNMFVETGVFGLYPKDKVWHLGKFPGHVDLTELDAQPNRALLVWINRPEYEKALAVRSKWERKGTWQALQGDCVSMMMDIASAVGLKVPDRSQNLLPFVFLSNLVNLNKS